MFGLKIFPFFAHKQLTLYYKLYIFPPEQSFVPFSSTSMIRYSNSGKMPFHISCAAWSPIVFYHCQIFFILAGQLCLLIIFIDAKVNCKSVDESQTEKSKRRQFLRIVQKYTSVPQEVVVNLSFWDKWTVPFCCVVFVSVSLPRIAFPHLLLFRGWWFLYLHQGWDNILIFQYFSIYWSCWSWSWYWIQVFQNIDIDLDLEIFKSKILILILILKKMEYWYRYWYWYCEKTAKLSKNR